MAIPEDDPYQHEQQEHEEIKDVYPSEPTSTSGLNQWLLAITLVLITAVAVSIGYTLHEQGSAQKLSAANTKLAAELTQTQAQVAGLSAKLNALTAPKIEPAPPADENWNGKAVSAEAGRRIHRANRRPAMSAWQRKMQAQLAEQQRLLNSTQQAVAKTQADLASNAASTESSLSGFGDSIAKNHRELVALEELGKRNYYEFDLTKSKRFAREGPVSLALRHTSTKHQNYDVNLLVDDFKLTRKNVDLYQPVVLETSGSPQPLELVVNRIGKNEVHGYVSVPKSYGERPSEGAVAAAQPVPTAKNSQPATPNPNTSQVASAAHR